MGRIKLIGREVLGLFAEDVRFTSALAIWIVTAAATRPWCLKTLKLIIRRPAERDATGSRRMPG